MAAAGVKLTDMKFSDLCKLAESLGVDQENINKAIDMEDRVEAKKTLIELIEGRRECEPAITSREASSADITEWTCLESVEHSRSLDTDQKRTSEAGNIEHDKEGKKELIVCQAPAKRNVVLFGASGDGKSTTANELSMSTDFKVGSGNDPVTGKVDHKDVLIDQETMWRIIDTIGTQSPLERAKDGESSVFKQYYVDMMPRAENGIDAFLVVLNGSDARFKTGADELCQTLLNRFGKRAFKNTIFVFTKCHAHAHFSDDFTEKHKQMAEKIAKTDKANALHDWLEMIDHRYVVIDWAPAEKDEPTRKRIVEEARQTIIRKVNELVKSEGFTPYTNEDMEAEEQWLCAKEAEIAGLYSPICRSTANKALTNYRNGTLTKEELTQAVSAQAAQDKINKRHALRQYVLNTVGVSCLVVVCWSWLIQPWVMRAIFVGLWSDEIAIFSAVMIGSHRRTGFDLSDAVGEVSSQVTSLFIWVVTGGPLRDLRGQKAKLMGKKKKGSKTA